MQLLHKQASRPLNVHTTMQLPSKITVYKMYSSQFQSVKYKSKRVALATKYLIFMVWLYRSPIPVDEVGRGPFTCSYDNLPAWRQEEEGGG
jgi:hypothetical protein